MLRKGKNYKHRVARVNSIYDRYASLGYSNREIWRRYIYPVFYVSERTFYNLLKASADPRNDVDTELQMTLDFEELMTER